MTAKKKTNKKTGKVEEMKNKEAPEIFSKLQSIDVLQRARFRLQVVYKKREIFTVGLERMFRKAF